ncbi:MAG: flagellar hook-length control protein FliK [Pirellulales bacterium]
MTRFDIEPSGAGLRRGEGTTPNHAVTRSANLLTVFDDHLRQAQAPAAHDVRSTSTANAERRDAPPATRRAEKHGGTSSPRADDSQDRDKASTPEQTDTNASGVGAQAVAPNERDGANGDSADDDGVNSDGDAGEDTAWTGPRDAEATRDDEHDSTSLPKGAAVSTTSSNEKEDDDSDSSANVPSVAAIGRIAPAQTNDGEPSADDDAGEYETEERVDETTSHQRPSINGGQRGGDATAQSLQGADATDSSDAVGRAEPASVSSKDSTAEIDGTASAETTSPGQDDARGDKAADRSQQLNGSDATAASAATTNKHRHAESDGARPEQELATDGAKAKSRRTHSHNVAHHEAAESAERPAPHERHTSDAAVSPLAAGQTSPASATPSVSRPEQAAQVLSQVASDVSATLANDNSDSSGDATGSNDSGRDGSDEHVDMPARLRSQFTARAAGETATGDRLSTLQRARFIQRVSHAFRLADERGGVVRLRLSPAELGSLRLEISLRDGAMTARMEVETAHARATVVENLGALRQRLADQNIEVQQFDVEIAGQASDGRPDGDGRPTSFGDAGGGLLQRNPAERAATETGKVEQRVARRLDDQSQLNLVI